MSSFNTERVFSNSCQLLCKTIDSSLLSLQGMFRAVGLRCVLYCSQVILLCRVLGEGGSARHHMQVQSKES